MLPTLQPNNTARMKKDGSWKTVINNLLLTIRSNKTQIVRSQSTSHTKQPVHRHTSLQNRKYQTCTNWSTTGRRVMKTDTHSYETCLLNRLRMRGLLDFSFYIKQKKKIKLGSNIQMFGCYFFCSQPERAIFFYLLPNNSLCYHTVIFAQMYITIFFICKITISNRHHCMVSSIKAFIVRISNRRHMVIRAQRIAYAAYIRTFKASSRT